VSPERFELQTSKIDPEWAMMRPNENAMKIKSVIRLLSKHFTETKRRHNFLALALGSKSGAITKSSTLQGFASTISISSMKESDQAETRILLVLLEQANFITLSTCALSSASPS